MKERGVDISHVSVYRWVIKFGPVLEKKFRKYKSQVNSSWRADETYIKVNGQWKYLYRAVDKNGNTIDFLLTAKRDMKAARKFFKKAIKNHFRPSKINIDKSGANTAGIKECNEKGKEDIEIRQNKYLNNIVEQDHRSIKRHIRNKLGFQKFHSAKIILYGIETLSMIFKGQCNYLPLIHKDPIDMYWGLVSA